MLHCFLCWIHPQVNALMRAKLALYPSGMTVLDDYLKHHIASLSVSSRQVGWTVWTVLR